MSGQAKNSRAVITWSLIGVAAVIWAVVHFTSGSAGAKYTASVLGYTEVNPASISVAVKVTNTGTASGTPTCLISAQDDSGAYSGFDSATLQDPVAPGKTADFTDQIVITHQGAQYVTQVTVTC